MENKTSKYLKYAVGEIILVVIGILIALQLNSWKEDKTEKKLVKQYLSSLIEDLKSDTTSISDVQKFRAWKFLKIDSLVQMLKDQQIEGYENELYYFGRILIRNQRFQSNDRTIAQLKNSAALRLIGNKRVTDSIIAYQQLVEAIDGNQEVEFDERYETHPLISKIYSPYVFEEMVTKNGIIRPNNNPPLRSYDPSLQQDFAHWIHQIKGSDYMIKRKLELLNRKAVDLINVLYEEYELE